MSALLEELRALTKEGRRTIEKGKVAAKERSDAEKRAKDIEFVQGLSMNLRSDMAKAASKGDTEFEVCGDIEVLHPDAVTMLETFLSESLKVPYRKGYEFDTNSQTHSVPLVVVWGEQVVPA